LQPKSQAIKRLMNNGSDIFKPGSLFFTFLPQEPTVHTQVYRHIGFAPTTWQGFKGCPRKKLRIFAIQFFW